MASSKTDAPFEPYNTQFTHTNTNSNSESNAPNPYFLSSNENPSNIFGYSALAWHEELPFLVQSNGACSYCQKENWLCQWQDSNAKSCSPLYKDW